ncbi:hypothetical protein HanRHA438_Chr04g0184001 [Helianthus annuus]|nr:hypothetical protein HanRHA438_Chr04g0184001 [Helianthus annuus]
MRNHTRFRYKTPVFPPGFRQETDFTSCDRLTAIRPVFQLLNQKPNSRFIRFNRCPTRGSSWKRLRPKTQVFRRSIRDLMSHTPLHNQIPKCTIRHKLLMHKSLPGLRASTMPFFNPSRNRPSIKRLPGRYNHRIHHQIQRNRATKVLRNRYKRIRNLLTNQPSLLASFNPFPHCNLHFIFFKSKQQKPTIPNHSNKPTKNRRRRLQITLMVDNLFFQKLNFNPTSPRIKNPQFCYKKFMKFFESWNLFVPNFVQ